MKKSTTIFYVALALGIILGACTPCDDGDPAESNAVQVEQTQTDSVNVD